AELLVDGIAPMSFAVSAAEEASRAEIERLKLELEVARREKGTLESSGAEFEKQERRIAKLVHQLEDAESEIERLRQERDADAGIASTFRSVQGLDAQDKQAPVKRVIIDGVFHANRPDDESEPLP
ncbi:MAG: hypothetical protein AAGG01_17560, partial [Planctomycetota bacterium]